MSQFCDAVIDDASTDPMTDPTPDPTRDRRPLTARSVIASTLLGVDPPRLPALALVRSGELFGLREGATRTALSRMASSGEVVADDAHYALRGPLLERHRRQQAARAPRSVERWDGTWTVAVVTAARRPAGDRSAFRDAARRLKLAELRDGVWVRPGPLPDDGGPSRIVLDEQATWLHDVRPDQPDQLVDAFDLAAWAGEARTLVEEMQAWQPSLDGHRTDALGETFVIAAAVLRHLVADPELPTELLPPDWPGGHLRRVFDRFDAAFKATWRAWHRTFNQA